MDRSSDFIKVFQIELIPVKCGFSTKKSKPNLKFDEIVVLKITQLVKFYVISLRSISNSEADRSIIAV